MELFRVICISKHAVDFPRRTSTVLVLLGSLRDQILENALLQVSEVRILKHTHVRVHTHTQNGNI